MNKTTVKYPFLTDDVEIYERENGHKIVLARKEGEMANVSTWVKTGSINETDENMARTGSWCVYCPNKGVCLASYASEES